MALVGYPSHPNIGDQAIWAGERMWLRAQGIRTVYSSDYLEYSAAALARALPRDGAILLHGGGNFGDVWPEHEGLRRRVLADFPAARIVQLPQSIEYRSESAAQETAHLLAEAEDVLVLCRDARSLEFARTKLGATAALSPDCAFALGCLSRGLPTRDVLVVARTDTERLKQGFGSDVDTVDWFDLPSPRRAPLPPDSVVRAILYRAARLSRASATTALALQPVLRRLQDGIASRGVAAGLGLLSTAKVVVTDRLHAHILCTLAGIPNVVLDTGYGKIDGFVESFTASAPTTYHVTGDASPIEVARGVLEEYT